MKGNGWRALLASLGLFCCAPAAFSQQAVDSLLAKLNALPFDERHAALVKGAQSERLVEWYATLPAEHSKALIDALHYQIENQKQLGAPVDYVIPDPLLIKDPSGIWVAKYAPHPHAAALFADFLFTREAQEIYARQNRLPARKDMEWRFVQKLPDRIHVLSVDKWAPRYNELIGTFDKIFR
jgi:hypothetical protein